MKHPFIVIEASSPTLNIADAVRHDSTSESASTPGMLLRYRGQVVLRALSWLAVSSSILAMIAVVADGFRLLQWDPFGSTSHPWFDYVLRSSWGLPLVWLAGLAGGLVLLRRASKIHRSPIPAYLACVASLACLIVWWLIAYVL